MARKGQIWILIDFQASGKRIIVEIIFSFGSPSPTTSHSIYGENDKATKFPNVTLRLYANGKFKIIVRMDSGQ